MGAVAHELGDAYLQPGFRRGNSSMLFWSYHVSVEQMRGEWLEHMREGQDVLASDEALTRNLYATVEYVDAVADKLAGARMACPDAPLVPPAKPGVIRMRHSTT